MPPVGFELTIPTSERPQTYSLDRAATANCQIKIPAIFFGIFEIFASF
jgi:hypothetical protein